MSATDHHDHAHHAPATGSVLDPVCGMTVDPKTAKHKAEHSGETYYFCSAGCKTINTSTAPPPTSAVIPPPSSPPTRRNTLKTANRSR